MVYLLIDKDAEWIRNCGQKGVQYDGKLLTMNIRQLVFAIRSYWQSELLSMGMKVLKTLESLHKSKSNGSAFRQSTCLLHIFEVSKFLLDCQYLNLTLQHKNTLQKFLGLSTTYFDLVNNRRKKMGQSCGLHLHPQVVAKAFMSIEDPLLIASSEDVNPRIDAPCAIFVDLRKSKEEIMSLLFPRKTALHVQNSLHNDGCDMIPVGGCIGELRMNWRVLEEISEVINEKQGESLSLLPVAYTIEKELEKNIHILGTALQDGKSFAAMLLHQLEVLSSAVFNMRILFSEQKEKNYISIKKLVEMLQGSRPRIDEILSHYYVMSQKSKAGPMVLSKCSNTTEVQGKCEEKIHIEGTDD